MEYFIILTFSNLYYTVYYMQYFNCTCGKLAKWRYMPSSSNPRYPYFCDDCVPRGCSCTYELKPGLSYEDEAITDDPANYEYILDDKGRKVPCCEFWYDEEGYANDNEEEIRHYDSNNISYYLTD